jgi:hypothetical protein
MPIINDIYEDDPSKNRNIDTDTGFYLKYKSFHGFSKTITFSISDENKINISFDCEIIAIEDSEKKKIYQEYSISSFYYGRGQEFKLDRTLIENLIKTYGGFYRVPENYKEIVTVEFSDRALEQLQAMGGGNV